MHELVQFFDEWEQIIPQDARKALQPIVDKARAVSEQADERALFETEWRMLTRPHLYDYRTDAHGDYNDRHLFRAWRIWQASTHALRDSYTGSTMVSDLQGPKITLRYATSAQADAAHELLCRVIDAAAPLTDDRILQIAAEQDYGDEDPKCILRLARALISAALNQQNK
jgi:hypothetical protein